MDSAAFLCFSSRSGSGSWGCFVSAHKRTSRQSEWRWQRRDGHGKPGRGQDEFQRWRRGRRLDPGRTPRGSSSCPLLPCYGLDNELDAKTITIFQLLLWQPPPRRSRQAPPSRFRKRARASTHFRPPETLLRSGASSPDRDDPYVSRQWPMLYHTVPRDEEKATRLLPSRDNIQLETPYAHWSIYVGRVRTCQ